MIPMYSFMVSDFCFFVFRFGSHCGGIVYILSCNTNCSKSSLMLLMLVLVMVSKDKIHPAAQ